MKISPKPVYIRHPPIGKDIPYGLRVHRTQSSVPERLSPAPKDGKATLRLQKILKAISNIPTIRRSALYDIDLLSIPTLPARKTCA
jgi:hypothetical protein